MRRILPFLFCLFAFSAQAADVNVQLAPGGSSLIAQDNGDGTRTLKTAGGTKTVQTCVTPTITAANAYGANYVVGGKLTFSGVFSTAGSGRLQSVVVNIKKVEAVGFTFFPFNSDPTNTTWTDASVAAINAADVFAVRNPVALSLNSSLGTHTVIERSGLGLSLAPGTTSLVGVLTVSAALTNQFAAGDVQVCVVTEQD